MLIWNNPAESTAHSVQKSDIADNLFTARYIGLMLQVPHHVNLDTSRLAANKKTTDPCSSKAVHREAAVLALSRPAVQPAVHLG